MCYEKAFGFDELIAELGESGAIHYLNQFFSCERNKDVESFLLNKALRFHKAKACSVHFIGNQCGDILAYFTLSFKTIQVNTSKSQLKRLTGGLTNDNQLNVYLIGQIGKNSLVKDNPVNLSHILKEVFDLIYVGQSLFGGKVVVLECENYQNLIQHYEQHGFRLINTQDEDELKTLFAIPEFL